MTNKHIKRCSISLVHWEIWIKTTMRYHVKLSRLAIIKKKKSVESLWRNWKPSTMEKSLAILQGVKHRTAKWFINSTPICIPKRIKNGVQAKICIYECSQQSSIIHNSQKEQNKWKANYKKIIKKRNKWNWKQKQ